MNKNHENIDKEVMCKRRHRRVKFVYPFEFKILLPDLESVQYQGLFTKISVSGASFAFHNEYGRINPKQFMNVRIKLLVDDPEEKRISLIARVKWVTKPDNGQSHLLLIGTEFEQMDELQVDMIKRIIDIRDKEHKMMWSLWERYVIQAGA